MDVKLVLWIFREEYTLRVFNPLNTKLNPICHLLVLGAHHILHVSRLRVKSRMLMNIS
jgi:hypothetical protein